MAIQEVAQIQMDEQVVEDGALLGMLQERADLQEKARAFRDMDRRVKEHLAALLGEGNGPLRIGPYRVTARMVPGGPRQFETQAHLVIIIEET